MKQQTLTTVNEPQSDGSRLRNSLLSRTSQVRRSLPETQHKTGNSAMCHLSV